MTRIFINRTASNDYCWVMDDDTRGTFFRRHQDGRPPYQAVSGWSVTTMVAEPALFIEIDRIPGWVGGVRRELVVEEGL